MALLRALALTTVAACGSGLTPDTDLFAGPGPLANTTDAPACTDGASCAPSEPCRQGRTTCTNGVAACVASANQPDGAACGGGGVCMSGACVAACVGNQLCQPANPCTLGVTVCANAVAEAGCVIAENKPDRTICGAGLVCSGGSCVSSSSCTGGAPCDLADPCRTGTMTCSSSAAAGTCRATGSKPDGTACGAGFVCVSASCTAACVAGVACDATNRCAVAVTACASASATPTCIEAGLKPDGARCGDGQECAAGRCVTPLRSVRLDNGGGTVRSTRQLAFSVTYTPPEATDKTLAWKVCAARPTSCSPDPTGSCLECATATSLGSITQEGVYTAPDRRTNSSIRVHVLACQDAVCGWSFVDVTR